MIRVLMYVFGSFALLGGLDRILGNRFGFGAAFEQGLSLLGPLAASMAGMMILAPWLAEMIARTLSPFYRLLGLDPSLLGSVLAIDMGGFQIAKDLADDPEIGLFSGVLIASTLGCTVSYSIPVGMELTKTGNSGAFMQGILCGLITMSPALFLGGLLMGLPVSVSLLSCVPLFLLSGLLAAGILLWRKGTEKVFRVFAEFLRILSAAGLTLGAVQSITGITLLKSLMPLEEAMSVVVSVCIVLLGALPFGEMLMRFLKRPLTALGGRLGIGPDAPANLLMTYLTITPGLASLPRLDASGCSALAAFAVCGGSALTAHLAVTLSLAPRLALPLLAVKTVGALSALALSLALERRGNAPIR